RLGFDSRGYAYPWGLPTDIFFNLTGPLSGNDSMIDAFKNVVATPLTLTLSATSASASFLRFLSLPSFNEIQLTNQGFPPCLGCTELFVGSRLGGALSFSGS